MTCRLHTAGLQLGADVDLPAIAASCHGYSGADLAALAREAAMHALSVAAAGYCLDNTQGKLSRDAEQPQQQQRVLDSTATQLAVQLTELSLAPNDSMVTHHAAPSRTGRSDRGPNDIGVVTAADFEAAMHHVGPSIVRGSTTEAAAVR